jgi:DNA-binding CsgD family transcriptional regulator
MARSIIDVEELPGWASFEHLVDGEMAATRRRYSDARASVARGLAASDAEEDHLGGARLATLGLRVEADAAAAADVHHRTRSAAPGIELATGHVVRLRALRSTPMARGGPADVAGALVATGEAEMARLTIAPDAADRWALAVDAWMRAGDPYMGALSRTRLAEIQIADAASRSAAAEPLRDALRTADGLGALPLARSIEVLARRARLRSVLVDQRMALAQEPPGVREARRLGLSDREIEVLALVADGLPDREIGERLFITTKTVGHHVSHILDKLALDRRGEAAAVAFRIGLVGEPA